MEKQTSYESVCDFAINKFKESLNEAENDFNLMEAYDFPHWKELTQKVNSVWLKNYSDKLIIYQDEKQIENLFSQFRSNMIKIMSKRTEYQSLKKYIDHVIDFSISQIQSDSFEQKENVNDQLANKLTLKPVVKLDPLSKQTIKNTKSESSKKELLMKIYQYDIECLIRGHSKESNINDNSTQVTDIAFELSRFESLNDIPSYTNIYATCGHNIINIIDSETGKILKRFNDDLLMNRTKESFNCLAWTILNNKLSVLVGAGTHGQIKVIVPKYSSCFARIDAHTTPITCLLFHYKYPNILLSASDDNTVKIWRIMLKEGESDLDSECTSELLGTIVIGDGPSKKSKETIFSLCFVKNDYLLISTRNNIYQVRLTDEVVFNRTFNQPMEMSTDMSNEDAISFMTSKPKTKENLLAKPVKMFGVSAQNNIYEESIIANKLIYFNNLLFANLFDSNFVYICEIEKSDFEDDTLVIKVTSNIKIGDEKSNESNKMSIHKDDSMVYLIKSSNGGMFYLASLQENLTSFTTLQRYLIPTDYTIKPYSDPGKKTNIKNYGLLEKPSVINAVCNGNTIVSVTNQNMIVTWKKSRVLGDEN